MPVPRQVIRLLFRPFESFFRTETLGGSVLIGATILALIWANSPLADSYRALWETPVTVGAPSFGLSKPLILWVNDLLMAIFFLVVGLEIKREILLGELNSPRKALLPVVAAIGGMIVPAGLFLLVASEPPASRGWGAPMATDIAFALGCLRLLGSRAPVSLIVFLTALAIIDDLGAILVIAIFYSSGVSLGALGVAALCVAVLVAMNLLGVRRPTLYVIAGIPLWVAVLKSGIHATIAGVIVGLCVPARALFSREDILDQARTLLAYAEEGVEAAKDALQSLEHRLEELESPLLRLEHALHPFVAYFVVPVFALANAGVSFAGVGLADLMQPASLGVIVGLVLGKQIGVFGAVAITVRLGITQLPGRTGWRQMYGASLLAGIGFTMSLFIAALAYGEGTPSHVEAKLGILVASVVAAVAGLLVIAGSAPPRPAAEADES